MQRLPQMLEREPLVEAVCEVRFAEPLQAVDILPGALFGKLVGKPDIRLDRLPTADIPRPMRSKDANFAYLPTHRLSWKQYAVLIGDQGLGVAVVQPYPRWPAFKNEILEILGHANEFIKEARVERYSLKYVNVIRAQSLAEQIAQIKLAMRLGEVDIKNEQFTLRVERIEEGTIHVTTIITGASGKTPDGNEITGAVIDIDSIRKIEKEKFAEFVDALPNNLEQLRLANKRKFFSCLTDETIAG